MKPLTQRLFAAYICWVMLHFIFLVAGDNFFGYSHINSYFGHVETDFWPFDADLDDYDITEFLIYTIMPVATYWVVRLIKETLPEN